MVDFIRIPPDSTGKRLQTKQWTVDGTDVHQQRVQIGCADHSDHSLIIDEHGAAFTRYTEGQPVFNAFSEMKTSQEYLVGAYEFSSSDYSYLFAAETATGGTVEYQPLAYSYQLTTTGFSGSSTKLTTNRYHYYQPGFSMMYKVCVSLGSSIQDGNIRRWGAFDDNNGVFFQVDSTGVCVVKRSDTLGSITDVKIYQTEWNLDTLDGNGSSEVILDVEKAWIYWIDFAYPRGVTRFGIFGPEGDRVTCHEWPCPGANVYANMGRPSLPIRVENVDTTNPGSPSTLRFIGAQVLNQTRDPNYTFWRYGGLSSGEKTVTTNTPLFSLQARLLNDEGKRNTVNTYPEALSLFVDSGAVKIDFVWNDESDDLLTDENFAVATTALELDNSATAIDSTAASYWVNNSMYAGAGVTNIDLRPIYELNDEGILLGGDGVKRSRLSIVATKLNGTTVKVHATMSVRELW